MLFWSTTIILYGILIGSFLNVCIYRIPRNESIAFPPSHCTTCGNPLKIKDLIPVFSYLSLKGKCRYCREKISLQYPIVELFNAMIHLILFMKFGISLVFAKYALLSSLLIIVFFIDLTHQIIPDGIILLGLAASIVWLVFHIGDVSWISGIIGFLLGGGLFLLIALVTHGAMGGGDIKLMGMLGLYLGWEHILLITFFSFIIGAIVSMLLIFCKLKGRKDYIPFGPFIGIAALLSIFFGNAIIQWYIMRFFL